MKTILLTSGGTRVPIDDVRYIGNCSTGRFGTDIVDILRANHDIEIIQLAAKHSDHIKNRHWHDVDRVKVIEFADFFDYQRKLDEQLALSPNVVVLAAAVSDYIMDPIQGKISSNEEELTITLKRAPKLISTVKQKCPNCKLVGFKLLSGSDDIKLQEACLKSLVDNHCNVVIGNDLDSIKAGKHCVYVYSGTRTIKNDSNPAYIVARTIVLLSGAS